MRSIAFGIIILGTVAGPSVARGQQPTATRTTSSARATLTGIIRDEHGTPHPDAYISLPVLERTVVSDANG